MGVTIFPGQWVALPVGAQPHAPKKWATGTKHVTDVLHEVAETYAPT